MISMRWTANWRARMIHDCILFHNEVDLLKLHLSVLEDTVDHFVIVEGHYTFSGKPKPTLYFLDNKSQFERWLPKITYVGVTAMPDPNRWVNESNARNRIMVGLEGA